MVGNNSWAINSTWLLKSVTWFIASSRERVVYSKASSRWWYMAVGSVTDSLKVWEVIDSPILTAVGGDIWMRGVWLTSSGESWSDDARYKDDSSTLLLHLLLLCNALPALVGNNWWCLTERAGTGRRLEGIENQRAIPMVVSPKTTVNQSPNFFCHPSGLDSMIIFISTITNYNVHYYYIKPYSNEAR